MNEVKKYMKDGMMNDFALLKKIHRKARHFYGTIIENSGEPWGVLLVDSTSQENPFSDITKQRIDSFALTISNIIGMEV